MHNPKMCVHNPQGHKQWKTRPHVTLACFNDVDEEKCRHIMEDFASSHAALFAYIGSLGFFTDTRTIFASPVMNSSMYDIQRDIHGRSSRIKSIIDAGKNNNPSAV